MKNEIMSKVNTIGKIGHIIANIGKVMLAIGAVACIVAGFILVAMPDDLVTIHMDGQATIEINAAEMVGTTFLTTHGATAITWGDVSSSLEVNGMEYGVVGMTPTENGFLIDAEADSYSLKLSQFANAIFLGALNCAVMWVVLHLVSGLCKQFKECETPFTEEIAKGLKKIAIALIPMAFITNLTTSVTNSMMSGKVNIVIGVDVTTILMVLLVFMLSAIFSYGTMLQQESDETL